MSPSHTAYEAQILAGARTPMATYNTHFKDLEETELGAIASREALRRSGVDPKRVDHVVFGNAMQTSGNAMYGARHVGLKAGLPDEVPALTVNRLCGSGIQSIVTAAQIIALGDGELGKRVEAERAARRKKVLDSDAEVRAAK